MTRLKLFLTLAAMATIICGLVYAAVQHSYRMGADDPQIQMAEDASDALVSGAPAQTIIAGPVVKAEKSLAPFLVIYDDTGKPVASSGTLNGSMPVPPNGIFDYVRAHGSDMVTWQTADGLRFATIVKKVNGGSSGFVLAARSLREVEKRENFLTLEVGGAWLALLIVAALGSFSLKRN